MTYEFSVNSLLFLAVESSHFHHERHSIGEQYLLHDAGRETDRRVEKRGAMRPAFRKNNGEVKMRIASRTTAFSALAALVVGIGVIGAGVPAFADQDYGSPSFASDSVVRYGLGNGAPVGMRYTGSIVQDNAAGKSCAPTIVHHDKTDTVETPAGC